jgi:threonine dehydratase
VVVVMPTAAPRSKIDAVRGYGAEVVLHDDRATLFDRLEAVRRERGLTFIHPFDDPVVLAGAGTAGLEIVEDRPEVDLVVVPVGGGGLLGGVASAVKALRPGARVVAVELEEGPGLAPALAAGQPVPVKRPAGTLADGMTPPFVGALPLEIAREAVDEIVTVSEAEIRDAVAFLITRAKLWVEGAGAAATAALMSGKVRADPDALVVALVSGGNADLASVAACIT